MTKPSFFLEVVGPAGAGKTTLARALCDNGNGFMRAPKPSMRNARNLPFFVDNALSLTPVLLSQNPAATSLTRREIWWMIYLNGWLDVIGNPRTADPNVNVLDHGPVYMLTSLLCFNPEMTRIQSFRHWWESTYWRWISFLDLLIWLDAPNPVLTERINARETWHVVKGKPEHEIHKFLNCYRSAFENSISWSQSRGDGPTLLSFFTDRASPQQIANEVRHECDMQLEGVSHRD